MATMHAIQAAIRPRCHRTSAAAQRVQQRGSISVGEKRIRDLPGVHLYRRRLHLRLVAASPPPAPAEGLAAQAEPEPCK